MYSGKIKSTYYVRLPKELIGLYNQMITKHIDLMKHWCRTLTFYMIIFFIILKFRLIFCQIDTDAVLLKNLKITKLSPAVVTFL